VKPLQKVTTPTFGFLAASSGGCSKRAVEQRSILFFRIMIVRRTCTPYGARGLHCVQLLPSTRAQPRSLALFLFPPSRARRRCPYQMHGPNISLNRGRSRPATTPLRECQTSERSVNVVRDNLKDLPRPRSTQLSIPSTDPSLRILTNGISHALGPRRSDLRARCDPAASTG
jgi:hypothetical protein